MPEQLERVVVLGAGTMGLGITQVFAQAGFGVTVVDVNPEALGGARERIDGSLSRLVKKGKISEGQAEETCGRVSVADQVAGGANADFVVEAIIEDEEAKKRVFAELDDLLRPGAVIASNTSSISITRLASATKRPERVIGMHFMNPVPLMELVEVIRGHSTSDHTHATTLALVERLGKTPVTVADYPGFVANRVLMPMINEALFALMEGVASREDIDTVFRLGMNHPMGPLTLADFIGLDVCLSILEVLHKGFGDPKYRPCPLLRRMVDAGQLGRKSGKGIFEYP